MTKNKYFAPELSTKYKNIFKRGTNIRIRIQNKKFTINEDCNEEENLYKAKIILGIFNSLLQDGVLSLNNITTKFVNESFKRGYVLPAPESNLQQVLYLDNNTNKLIKLNEQNKIKTKTFAECFAEKSIEYRRQETVIPYAEDGLKFASILTYENYISRLDFFNEIEVANLNIQHLEAFVRHHINEDNSYKYVNEMLRPIKEILEHHVEFGLIECNILENKGLKKFMRKNLRKPEKYPTLLTTDDVQKIVNADNCIIKFIVLFGLLTGCRVGEVQNLTWSPEDISIKENRITIKSQFSSNVESTPKSKTSVRNIPIVMQTQNPNFINIISETALFEIICFFHNKARICKYIFYDPSTKSKWRNSDAINYRMKKFLQELDIFKNVTYTVRN